MRCACRRGFPAAPSILPKSGWAIVHPAHPPLMPLAVMGVVDTFGLWLQEMKPIVMRKRTELIHSDHEETLLWWSIHFACCCRHLHGTQTKAVLTLPVAQSKFWLELKFFKNSLAKFRLEKLKNNCMQRNDNSKKYFFWIFYDQNLPEGSYGSGIL